MRYMTFPYVFLNSRLSRCGKNLVKYLTESSSNWTFVSGPRVDGEVQPMANVSDNPKLDERSVSLHKSVIDIFEIVKNNRGDVDSRLSMLTTKLSVGTITQVIGVLNSQRVPGMSFFEWIWSNKSQLNKNPHICSLMICNLGKLDDYDAMFRLLKKFTSERICLTYAAFNFLPVSDSSRSLLKESTNKLVDLLNKTGGSCRNSGVHALVEMFCKLDLLEMANHVIDITERKESYFRLMIREKCRRGLTDDAYASIREMTTAGCVISTTVYNYVLGSLWKNGRMNEASTLLDEMTEAGVHPDAITFEILINHLCSSGAMDDVQQLLDYMVSQEFKPRPSTHATVIKTLFSQEKFDEASKHVDSCATFRTSSNMLYSLLANLYRQKGDLISARDTLLGMMEKSLKPNVRTYKKLVKQLKSSGKANLARDLESSHRQFAMETGDIASVS